MLLLTLLPAASGVAEARDYVRLHVIASDDSAEAQALKFRVRDAVLARARALLDGVEDADAAWAAVTAHRVVLEAAARSEARDRGYMGDVRCETGVYPFPDRWYGGVRVPAGDYRALRVKIGAAEGRNWWCVLYPSLCYPEDMDPDAPVFYSALLNWFRALTGGDGA